VKKWPFDIERVYQIDDHGCGIAAVATVCGVTYSRAKATFFPGRAPKDGLGLHVSQEQMLRAIRDLGFSGRVADDYTKFKDRPVIVPFSWCPAADPLIAASTTHCIIWNPIMKRFHDPGPDHDRRLSMQFYRRAWEMSKYQVIVVTGKKRR
jgi:hypothetical protein